MILESLNLHKNKNGRLLVKMSKFKYKFTYDKLFTVKGDKVE